MGGRSVRSLRCARLVASKGSCGCSAELPSGSFLRLTALTCRLQWSAMRDLPAVRCRCIFIAFYGGENDLKGADPLRN